MANNSSNINYKKNNKKCNTSRDHKGKTQGHKEYINDPKWYSSVQNMDNMAKFPFADAIGDNLPLFEKGAVGDTPVTVTPGIAVLNFIPTIGNTTGDNASNYARRAADAFFDYLTQGFTGNVTFEAPDLLFTQLAAASIFMKVVEGKRVYRALNKYSVFNKFLARTLVSALGFDYDDLVANKANFRAELNIRIDEINKLLAVPGSFSIMQRWIYLVDHIFCDSVNPDKAGIYLHKPRKYFRYDATTMNTGTCLLTVDTKISKTVTDYFSELDTLISDFRSTDVRNIMGSIRRVYSENMLISVAPIEANESIEWTHNDRVMEAFHNMSFGGGNFTFACERKYMVNPVNYGSTTPQAWNLRTADGKEVAVYQNQFGDIISKPGIEYTATYVPNMSGPQQTRQILDVLEPGSPSSEIILDATADMFVRSSIINGTKVDTDLSTASFLDIYCRTNACESITIYYFDGSSTNVATSSTLYGQYRYNADATTLGAYCDITKFNYHPFVLFNQDDEYIDVLGELENFTTISNEDLKNLHQRTLYYLLMLPESDKSVTR